MKEKVKQCSLQIPVSVYKKLGKYAERWGMSARAIGKILIAEAINKDLYKTVILENIEKEGENNGK